jgi:sulfur relay (sulfurtransferase) complex TusBCD TusD component (DsrE family)
MRAPVADAIVPVGWPPPRETLAHMISLGIPLSIRTACSRARGVLESDLAGQNATFATLVILVHLIEWADKILSE